MWLKTGAWQLMQHLARTPSGWRGLVALPPVLAAVALYLLAFLSGWVSLPGPFGGYNGERWGALLLLAMVAIAGRTLPRTRALWLPLVILLLGLLSSAVAPYPAEALAVLAMHAGLLLLAWTCALAVWRHGVAALRGWCCVALAAALIYSAIVAVGVVTLSVIGHMDTRNLFMGFANRRFFLQLTTPLLPCLIALVFDPALVRRFRVLAGFAALLWSMLIWLNDGSGALYALIIGVIAAALILGGRRVTPWAAAIAACMATGWLVLQIGEHWLPLREALQSATIPGLSGRLELWHRALEAIASRPVLGWGPGAFSHFTDVSNGHPHNMLLAWATGYGLLGLGLVLWLFLRALQPLQMRRRLLALPADTQPYAIAISIGALSGLAHANVSGVTIMPMAQILLITTLGLWAGLLGPTASADNTGTASRSLRLVLAGAIVICAAWSMTQNCALQPNRNVTCAYMPAFWFAYPTTGGVETPP